MDEITLLVNYLKSSIEKCEDFKLILTAYNTYISDETDRINYIYDVDNNSDLICLIQLGANLEVFANLHKSGNKHVILNENGALLSLPPIGVLKYIIKESENLARCILAYPFLEAYKPIYIKYITNKIIK